MVSGKEEQGEWKLLGTKKSKGKTKCPDCTGHYPPTLYKIRNTITGEVRLVGRKCAGKRLKQSLWLPGTSTRTVGLGVLPAIDTATNSLNSETSDLGGIIIGVIKASRDTSASVLERVIAAFVKQLQEINGGEGANL